ncbi:MAG: hypothetical protein KDA21_13345 [Phycisphaerales bacterium]|nr:hypothetical protein [Phycisphaerales bacterium]
MRADRRTLLGIGILGVAATGVAAGPACPGDADGNGTTDFADLAALLDSWGCRLTLYGWEGTQPNETLRIVDIATVSASSVGPAQFPAAPIIAEIEYAAGVIYASDTSTNTRLHRIDATSGVFLDTLTLVFPPEGNVITSMEFIDGVLYAGLTSEGPGTGDMYLSTVDLGTGVVTPVGGASGIGSAAGGLAWDGTTLLALSSGGSTPTLFSMDLVSGVATSVAPVMLGGASPGPLTALEFAHDGELYALPSRNNVRANHLLRLDPVSGVASDLGLLVAGSARIVALTNGEPCAVDLTGDFATDFADLNEVLDDWGCGVP